MELLSRFRDLLAPYIANIFNCNISVSKYPDTFKLHKIVAIPIPIAILSSLDKVIERIMDNQLLSYMGENLLHWERTYYTYAYIKGVGTKEAIVKALHLIFSGLDQGYSSVAGLLCDINRTFDLVDNSIILNKLSYYGIKDMELELFRSYLGNRT